MASTIAFFACARNEPSQEATQDRAVTEARPLDPLPEQKDPEIRTESQPQLPEGSGKIIWAKGFAGQLIEGLDGWLYEPYLPPTIERTQIELKGRGLYDGPVNGILDVPTMKALYAFQEANYNLQVCGVPTPRTRKLLKQGSHTDPLPGG
jgi:hypothetical protein